MADIARRAGVSAMTVSRVINGGQRVSPDTAQRVRQVIAELGYVPNITAAALAKKRSHAVGVVVPTFGYGAIFSRLLQGISETLREKGYETLVGMDNYQREQCLKVVRSFLSRRVDGLFVVGSDYLDEIIPLLHSVPTPFVQLLEATPNPIGLAVGLSHQEAGASLARHLLAQGHRDALLVEDQSIAIRRQEERYAGAASVFQEVGLPLPRHRTSYPLDIAGGHQLLDELSAERRLPRALILHNDNSAMGVLFAAQRQGLKVPEDLALATIGFTSNLLYTNPSITAVSIDGLDIGQQAAELLLEKLAGNDWENPVIDTGFHLHVRGST